MMICKYTECNSGAVAKGYCRKHYYSAVRNGFLPRPRCEVEGCNSPMFRNGMCNKHNLRVERHGDPFVCKKLANNTATPERKRALRAAARKRYMATPYGKLRKRFNDAKRRLRFGAISSGGLLKKEMLILWDGQICGLCGDALGEDKTFDHIIPLGRGGDNTIKNLQLAHLKCNQKKNASSSPSSL